MQKRRMIGFLLLGLSTMAALCGVPAAFQPPPPPTVTQSSPIPVSNTTTPAVVATVVAQTPFTALPPTNTPLPTTTLGPTNTPAPTADPLHTACDNPYWPLRQGAIWKGKTYTATVTSVTGDANQALATVVYQTSTGDVNQTQYACEQGQIGFGDSIVAYANGTTQTSNVVTSTGWLLLASDKLTLGAHWAYTETVDGFFPNKVDVNGKIGYQPAHHHDTFVRDCSVTKTETLTVTVGVFPAIVVDCKGVDHYNTNGSPFTAAANDELTYARGLGSSPDTVSSFHIP